MARAASAQRKTVFTILGWGVGLLIFFPILWIVVLSFKPETYAIAPDWGRLLSLWTTENYATVQERSDYWRFFTNSIILSVGSTLLGLLIAVPAAWAMAFSPTRNTKNILMWMLSTKMLPAVGVLVPITIVFRELGLLDSRIGLVVVLMLVNLPIIVWMLFTYFKEIPGEILEAARMDGAGLKDEIVHVLVPMAVPGIASTLLLKRHPGLERGLLDLDADDDKGGAADPVHRQLLVARGPVLRQALGRLDAGHRAHPGDGLAVPAPARARPHLRRREMMRTKRSGAV